MSHVTHPASRSGAAFSALFVPVFLAFFLAFFFALFLASASVPACAQAGSTVIDVNAKLHVTVASEAQLTGDYTVDADGNITMLYINQVHVQGLTPAQAAAAIRGEAAVAGKKATGLSQFYVMPQVVVAILDEGGIGVTVNGLVSAPRRFVVPTKAHLDDVLQQAVPALNADLSKIEITRGDTKARELINYRAYLDSKDDSGNPLLHDGDMISVSTREAQPIFINVQGQVVKPGRISVPSDTTAYSALQAAGGPTPAANVSAIVVKHFGAQPGDTIPFNYAQASQNPTDVSLNPPLQDGDTLVVPSAPVAATYTLTGPGIRNPAEYPLPDSRPITLAAAIGKAGGLTDRAKIKDVQIIRVAQVGAAPKSPASQASQTIKLDASDPNVQGQTLVQPGDNIFIGQGSPGRSIDPFQVIGIAIALIGIFGRR